ncbi:MAG: hypothetical protein M1833_004064 [Piccolia ochrophora]|nr:MAG: hypothetical protein M1833_004064 [Piccolia ochrophora]
MPPLPFPSALSIGTDICHVPRIRALITKNDGRWLGPFVRRIFRPDEDVWPKIDRITKASSRSTIDTHTADPRQGSHKNGNHAAIRPQVRGQVGMQTQAGTPQRAAIDQKVIGDQELRRLSQWLAGRFAAKEATIKAVSRPLTWHDIAVHEQGRKPYVTIAPVSSAAASALGSDLRAAKTEQGEGDGGEGQIARVSISHDGEYATATVLVVDEVLKDNEALG